MLAGLAHTVGAWAQGAGGLGLLAVAVLDSSVLPIPNVTEALILYLTLQAPHFWWYYAALGALGTLIGSWPVYLVGRKGGQAVLDRHLAGAKRARVLQWYERSAFAALAGPAFLPPPFPLKVFILLAGTTAYPVARVSAALALGRGARHAIEAALAAIYRDDAVRAFERYGPTAATALMVGVALVVGGVMWWQWRRLA